MCKAGAAAIALGLGTGAQAMVIQTLDDFSTGAQSANLPTGPVSSNVPAAVPGGSRTVTVTRNDSIAAANTTISVVTSAPGFLTLSNDALTQGDADVVWDANSAGLGGVDLTVPGFTDLALSLTVISIDQGGVDLAFNVTDTAANSASLNVTDPGAGEVLFPYDDFVGVDMTSVDAITLSVVTDSDSSDVVLDLFGISGQQMKKMPIPASAALLGLGLLGLAGLGRRR
jgi:hypothetical protein